MPSNWAELRYDHNVIISDLYVLAEGESLDIGDVVEFTTDPPTKVRMASGDQYCYEVRRGCRNYDLEDTLVGTGADDAIGISFSRIKSDSIDRMVAIIIHGPALVRACSLEDINPNDRVKCCSDGQVTRLARTGLTALEASHYNLGKAITAIPAGLVGTIFVGSS
ncbi:MAG: hypothetical protein ACTSQ8_09190 [Candidatus Helarchaeota archaeon]